ncbi:cell division protein ZipA [Photobacterium nomapromontoriensis]|uniref:cell division protein ZipA n=1 Tax=Photobacterium nomapromontoriensis TaxID=2910237 RepID=UPI003D121505
MQELRLVLIIVGTLAIAALLLHGLWSNRKENPAKFGEKPIGKLDESSRDSAGFDRDGVGSVRVVSEPVSTPPNDAVRPERKEPALHFGSKLEADPLLEPQQITEPVRDEQPVMTAQEVASPVAVRQSFPAPDVSAATANANSAAVPAQPAAPTLESSVSAELESTLTIEDIERDQHLASDTMHVAQPYEQAQPAARVESAISHQLLKQEMAAPEVTTSETVAEQMVTETISSDDIAAKTDVTAAMSEPMQQPVKATLPPDYIVLNVHGRKGELLRGSRLFNAFEQQNLIFGENAVYHRHTDMAGTGPVVFTVTNMVHPAHFPEGGSDSFETPGVAFYLMLPCESGSADQAFKLMLQTVQRIADSLGADVLDHERSLITPRRIGEYREKALRYTTA